MLPMTTRKKLSHLRAQIKRQASKAARSRLEKRSSVGGVIATTSTDTPGSSTIHEASGGGGGGEVCASSGRQNLSSILGGCSLDSDITGSNATQQQQHHYHHHHHKHPKQAGDGYHSKDTNNSTQPNLSSSIDYHHSPSAYLNSPSTSSPTSGPASANAAGSHMDAGISSVNSSLPSGQQNESCNSALAGSSSSGNKHQGESHLIPGNHHSIGVSAHQKNFKQKLIALIKKFRTDGSDFDTEEQYREALERELMKAAAGRGSRAIEELLEEDIDVEEDSDSETDDWDNISDSSTPKPSLRPFFSSTTLDKI